MSLSRLFRCAVTGHLPRKRFAVLASYDSLFIAYQQFKSIYV
jgi:hypothetical protein